MRGLHLNLGGMDLHLDIKGWGPPPEPSEDESGIVWCRTELLLWSRSIRHKCCDELLTCGEVSELCDALGDLLTGQMKKRERLGFCEPDLEFSLFPPRRKFNVPGKVWYTKGYEDVPIRGEMRLRFWCERGLTANYLNVFFDEESLRALWTYLRMVTGELPMKATRFANGSIEP